MPRPPWRSFIGLACPYWFFFFFTDPATTEIYTLSLHDALPISWRRRRALSLYACTATWHYSRSTDLRCQRSEEHTSELQSLTNLVCRLLLEKKKNPQACH